MKKGCPIFTDWTTFFPHTSRMLHVGFSWGGKFEVASFLSVQQTMK